MGTRRESMSDSFQYKAVYNAATQTWIGNWSWDTRKASNSERLKVYESVKTGLQALGPPYTWNTEKRDKARQLLMLEDGFKCNLYQYTEEQVERLFNHHREFYREPSDGSEYIRFNTAHEKFMCTKCYWLFDRHPHYPDFDPRPAKRAKR